MMLISPCKEGAIGLPFEGVWIVEIIRVAEVVENTGRGVVETIIGIGEVGGTTADVG